MGSTMTLKRIPASPLLLALLAACGDHAAVREADANPPRAAAAAPAEAPAAAAPACAPDNGGLRLQPGFCATIFADGLSGPRHIAVAPNGDVYVALGGGRNGGGGVLALRDDNGDGKADHQESFGSTGGSGIAVSGGWVYFAPNDRVVRWRLAPGRLAPAGEPETIVSGLPTGGHTAKTIVLDGRGGLFVNLGSRTNACQVADRQAGSPGHDPCTETDGRAGIWRFDANRANQTQANGQHYARGIRNAMGLAFSGAQLYATQHGRDQLHDNWPALFDDRKSAENPGEEFIAVSQGDDFGWPYCFYDVDQHRLVLAPEYGGKGNDVGRCAQKKAPVAAFPGHWAPESLAFYTGTRFPAKYRGGAFIAFHGSWNRAPLPQEGFRVTFVPMTGGRAGTPETFADATPAGGGEPSHRPMGLVVAPDGSLYVTDDAGGRIWRIFYTGR
jgi:glucose/arabinose dehydrogenase